MQAVEPLSFGPLTVVSSPKPTISRNAISRAFERRIATVRTQKLTCIVSAWDRPGVQLVFMARTGTAVARNRLRRRAQAYIREQWNTASYIVIVRVLKNPADISRTEIISCLQEALEKAKCLQASKTV